MDKCPFCGAETRPGDNFCLNCGNRLLSMTPPSASEQAQPVVGESTLPSPEDWGGPGPSGAAPQSPGASDWPDVDASTVTSGSADPPTFRADLPGAKATMERIEDPARFILRSDNGETLHEYPLDKQEITIGRAPSSDILLSKDKLTSRRHATVHYENNNYVLRDERSANGTFVNGQQIEEMVPRVLQDGDHVGIGEHELIFRSFAFSNNVEDLPTIAVNFDPAAGEMTYRTRDDELAAAATKDEFSTRTMDNDRSQPSTFSQPSATNGSAMPNTPQPAPSVPVAPLPTSFASAPPPAPATNVPSAAPSPAMSTGSSPMSTVNPSTTSPDKGVDMSVSFNRLTNIAQPTLPDITGLMAALSTLDGQVMAFQEQISATQEAMRNHDAELAQSTNQLRAGVRRVSDRMDNTIADVARSREALAWTELLQLMDDVMNNPRDIEYVTKLARKARELNKVFQIHQNVLNTMAECNSLLRSMIGEDK